MGKLIIIGAAVDDAGGSRVGFGYSTNSANSPVYTEKTSLFPIKTYSGGVLQEGFNGLYDREAGKGSPPPSFAFVMLDAALSTTLTNPSISSDVMPSGYTFETYTGAMAAPVARTSADFTRWDDVGAQSVDTPTNMVAFIPDAGATPTYFGGDDVQLVDGTIYKFSIEHPNIDRFDVTNSVAAEITIDADNPYQVVDGFTLIFEASASGGGGSTGITGLIGTGSLIDTGKLIQAG